MKNRFTCLKYCICYLYFNKRYFIKNKPAHILYIQSPEDMEGMILGGLSKELKTFSSPSKQGFLGVVFLIHIDKNYFLKGKCKRY